MDNNQRKFNINITTTSVTAFATCEQARSIIEALHPRSQGPQRGFQRGYRGFRSHRGYRGLQRPSRSYNPYQRNQNFSGINKAYTHINQNQRQQEKPNTGMNVGNKIGDQPSLSTSPQPSASLVTQQNHPFSSVSQDSSSSSLFKEKEPYPSPSASDVLLDLKAMEARKKQQLESQKAQKEKKKNATFSP